MMLSIADDPFQSLLMLFEASVISGISVMSSLIIPLAVNVLGMTDLSSPSWVYGRRLNCRDNII